MVCASVEGHAFGSISQNYQPVGFRKWHGPHQYTLENGENSEGRTDAGSQREHSREREPGE